MCDIFYRFIQSFILPRKAAGCGFGVAGVLSFPLTIRETCCPGELHLPLALFTLCKLSLSLTFGQTCSRAQLSWLVKFHSRSATLSKDREHPSVRAFFFFFLNLYPASAAKCTSGEKQFLRKEEASLHYAPGIRKAQKNAAQNFPKPNVPAD